MSSKVLHIADVDSTVGAGLASGRRVAVFVPCYNEELTIGDVVRGFRAALPEADIYVCDNNSRDRTIEVARTAGALVRREVFQGKGNVVRHMFADIDADVYVMVDGDNTYDAASAPLLVGKLLDDQLDMVVAARMHGDAAAWRAGHRFGNWVLNGFVAWLFGALFKDILSGYRVFSRRFVKSFPSQSRGFEIETELTVHALEQRMPVAELPTPYGARPAGSVSKLHTFRDGWHILMVILRLFREERPLQFFSYGFVALFILAVALGAPVVSEYLATGLVPRLPTAVLATGIMLLAFLSLACGLILDTVTRGRREVRRLAYLATPGIAAAAPDVERPPRGNTHPDAARSPRDHSRP